MRQAFGKLGWLAGMSLLAGAALAEEHPAEATLNKPAAAKPATEAPAAKPAAASGEKAGPAIKLPGKLAASMAAQQKPKPPEAMAPEVKQGKPPEIKMPVGLSPEVRAPDGLRPPKARVEPTHEVVAHNAPAKPRAAHAKPHAPAGAHKKPAESASAQTVQLQSQVAVILKASQRYLATRGAGYFGDLKEAGAARATVVSCADSPHAEGGFKDFKNGLYRVRTAGNQIEPAEGTIEYGVRKLRTPVLMIVGAPGCRTVLDAMADESGSAASANMGLPKGIGEANGALLNVNNQVEGAILTFAGEVEAGRLAVIGAYYDVNNDLKRGKGKLVVTNINGETQPAAIKRIMQKGDYFHYAFMR